MSAEKYQMAAQGMSQEQLVWDILQRRSKTSSVPMMTTYKNHQVSGRVHNPFNFSALHNACSMELVAMLTFKEQVYPIVLPLLMLQEQTKLYAPDGVAKFGATKKHQ